MEKKIKNVVVIHPLSLTCENFAKELLREANCNYTVYCKPNKLTSYCNYRKREIVLSQPVESVSLSALYEAGHEVGHAYLGPSFFKRNVYFFYLVVLAMIILPLYAAWTRLPENVASLLFLPVYLSVAAICLDTILSEVKASLFSIGKLKIRINDSDIMSQFKKVAVQDIASDILLRAGTWSVLTSAMWSLYQITMYFSGKT